MTFLLFFGFFNSSVSFSNISLYISFAASEYFGLSPFSLPPFFAMEL